MKRLFLLSLTFAALAACSGGPAVRYQLTMNLTDAEKVSELAQETVNVMERRLEAMEQKNPSGKVESTGSGSAIVSVSTKSPEALDALTKAMQEPFDFAIMAQAAAGQKADVTVEKYGDFMRTDITGADLAWIKAEKEPGKELGQIHLDFTPAGRDKMAKIFKEMNGKNIGIFVRGQLVSLLQVATGTLADDIVIQDIPSLELAQTFAEDVNVGIHVTVTPLP